jgi:hypothetical protein
MTAGLLALQASAGVVVTGPGLEPWTSHACQPASLPKEAGASAAPSETLGLNDSEFISNPFTLDWLASNLPSSWPECGITEPLQVATTPPAAPRIPASETAKWLGVCGAIILLLRRSIRH